MGLLRTALMIVAVLAIAMGLLFCAQGLGIVRWPASSTMIDTSVWSFRGAAIALIGLVVLLFARRIR